MTTAPSLPQALVETWGISDIRLVADTHSSYISRARGANGCSLVVKSLKPQGHGELAGIDYLDWRDGTGAVRLVARSGIHCLMEDGGDLQLSEYHRLHGDEAATEIIAGLLPELHSPSQKRRPASLVPLDRHFTALFHLAGTAGQPEILDLAGWAARETLELLASQQDSRPLHGDLHHDNIVSDGDGNGRWRAIDPHGLFGDPAYDVANVFGNPIGTAETVLDPQRAIRLAQRFAVALNCSPRKVLRYAAVHALLSVAWTLEDAASQSGNINMAERLAFARLAQSLLIEQFVI